MRALVLEDFGTMAVQERPRPEPQRGEVLMRILATGICGSDTHGYMGETGRRSPGQVMGHETVGRVEGFGSGSHGTELEIGGLATFNPLVGCGMCSACKREEPQLCPGKYVIGADPSRNGAFSEFVAVPTRNVIPLPEDMPISHAVLIEPLAVALHALRRAGLKRGETVLVVGGGPIGQSTVLAARYLGAAGIVASEPDAGRRALMAQLGAEVIDPTVGDVPTEVTRILGAHADKAVDAVGMEKTLRAALESTRLGGTVCLVGLAVPNIGLDAYQLSVQERTLVGTFCYAPTDFRDAADCLAQWPTGAELLVSRSISLEQAPTTFASLAAGDVPPGKVVIYLGQELGDAGA
jgi:threonine dehydrogenase-like Zn-dependent dehydrogenase